MPSSTSPNMGLFLPVPGSTAGPQWATENTANASTVDTHDHTTGKGVKIPVAALTINADFSWLTFGQTNIGYASFIDKLLTANLTVNASMANVLGQPYWRDSAGVVKKILLTGDAAAVPNSGNVAGRYGIWVLIDRTALTAAASYAKTFSAGAYRELKFKIRQDSGDATGITITLTGLTGTYKFGALYTQGTALTTPASVGSNSNWSIGMGATPWAIRGEVDIETGGIRQIAYTTINPNGLGAGSNLSYRVVGQNDDTTHDITGFSCAFTGGTPAVTGIGELWGVPF